MGLNTVCVTLFIESITLVVLDTVIQIGTL